MKLFQILEKIKSGEFTIDSCGHRTNDLKEHCLDRYERMVANANGANDGKWHRSKSEKSVDEVNTQMRDYYRRELDMNYSIADLTEKDDRRIEYILNFEDYCFCCGENLHYTFNGKGLSLNVRFNNNKPIKDEKLSKLFGGCGAFEFYNCAFSKLKPFKVTINVSGELVFANWFPDFEEDSPADKKYTKDYKLNSLRGRRGIAKWKAKNQNIAYTQVGSGSTAIWMNEDRTHGYITSGYIEEDDENYDEITNKYVFPKFLEGYEKVGRTDVAVWRVEMADSNKVNLDKVKEKWKIDGNYPDAAIVKVPKG